MYWHVTIATDERLSGWPSHGDRRAAMRVIARLGGVEVPWFCVADDHVHLVVGADRRRAGRVSANVAVGLRRIARTPLAPARIHPVNGRDHLERLVRYVLDQTTHHELRTATHPALWPGSSFPDLVGARILPGFDPAALAEALPRFSAVDLYAAARLPVVEAASDEMLGGLSIDALARAAADVVGADSVTCRSANGARALVARVGAHLGLQQERTARVLGISARQIRRLVDTEPDALLANALRRWVAIQQAVRVAQPTEPLDRRSEVALG